MIEEALYRHPEVFDAAAMFRRHGITLDTDEYVPDTGCPCPVIVVQTPSIWRMLLRGDSVNHDPRIG